LPLIAEAEISRRVGHVQLCRYSYHSKSPPDWPYDVNPVSQLPHDIKGLDGLIIGGGHLIRFDKEVAPGYAPSTPDIHHPTGYWLTPALLALQADCPVVWNAPGVHGNIPTWAAPLVHLAISRSRYVAVRDEASKQALLPYSEGSPQIELVPCRFRVRSGTTAGLVGRPFVVHAAMPGTGVEPALYRDPGERGAARFLSRCEVPGRAFQ
jgi:homopolymeric O-antigen transport system ATP-binding protein